MKGRGCKHARRRSRSRQDNKRIKWLDLVLRHKLPLQSQCSHQDSSKTSSADSSSPRRLNLRPKRLPYKPIRLLPSKMACQRRNRWEA